MYLHRSREVMERRRDVQDLALGSLEFFKSGTANVKGSFCIDIDVRAESICRKLFSGTQEISCCTIDYDIDFPKFVDGLINGVFYAIVDANVSGDRKTLTTVLLYILLHRDQVFLFA